MEVIAFILIGPVIVFLAFMAFDTFKRRGEFGVNLRLATCSKCGTYLPFRRVASSIRQTLFGGWNCPTCGTELDKWGKELKTEASLDLLPDHAVPEPIGPSYRNFDDPLDELG
ncbi:MAG: hypothetical protein ACRD43_09995, partial [Pyrinomonadaceae bacterium]